MPGKFLLGIQTCNPLTDLCFIYKVHVKTLKLECAYFIFLDKKKLFSCYCPGYNHHFSLWLWKTDIHILGLP